MARHPPPPPPPPPSSFHKMPSYAAKVLQMHPPSAPPLSALSHSTHNSDIHSDNHSATVSARLSDASDVSDDRSDASYPNTPGHDPPASSPAKRDPSTPSRFAFFRPHRVEEAAISAYLPLRLILLLRLAAVAALVGHLVFFSLRRSFRYTEYLTWNYAALTLALLAALTCSLLHLIRDNHHQDNENGIDTADVENQTETESDAQTHTVHSRSLRILVHLTVPLYQVAVSATIFGAVVFWSAVFPTATVRLSYPQLTLAIVAPVLALLDFILSFSMRFRLIYIAPYVLYNVAYVAVASLNSKSHPQLFLFLRHGENAFIPKAAGLAAGCILMAVLLYFIMALRFLRSSAVLSPTSLLARLKTKRADADVADEQVKKDRKEEQATTTTDADLQSLGLRKEPAATEFSSSLLDSPDFERVDEETPLPMNTPIAADRTAIPPRVTSMAHSASASARSWMRVSSARLVATVSSASMASDDGIRIVRSDSVASSWDDLEAAPSRKENETFSMPGYYDSSARHTTPLPAELMAPPSRLPRPVSARMARNKSTTQRVRPHPALPSSVLAAAVAPPMARPMERRSRTGGTQ